MAKTRYAGPFLGFIYACLIAVSTLRGYFHLVELPWFVTQFAYGAVILLGLGWLFVSGNTSRLNTSVNVMAFQMIPNLIILVWSVALWVWERETFASIIRGSSMILYQLLLLSMLIFAGVMFGKKAIEYTALGFIIANTLILMDVMRRHGIVSTITGFAEFLLSAGSKDNAISVSLEVQDLTFGIGIMLVYYLTEGQEEHWRKFYILALGFYFVTGLKRILLPAVFVGAMYVWMAKRFSRKNQITYSVAIGVILLIISITYVILIRTELWFEIMDDLGVNLMGRKRLYSHVKPYYSISPVYMGIGYGRVSKILELVESTGNRRLHSDVLRLYIELGMIMFLLWCAVTYIITFKFLDKTYSLGPARMYFAITLLMFVTFLTDNTIEKYCPQIAWHILPLAMVLGDKEAFAESLVKKIIPDSERRSTWTKK